QHVADVAADDLLLEPVPPPAPQQPAEYQARHHQQQALRVMTPQQLLDVVHWRVLFPSLALRAGKRASTPRADRTTSSISSSTFLPSSDSTRKNRSSTLCPAAKGVSLPSLRLPSRVKSTYCVVQAPCFSPFRRTWRLSWSVASKTCTVSADAPGR